MTLSTRDKVRLRIGDTDPDAPILNDEELDDFLDQHANNVYLAAADACDAIAAQYSVKPDFSTDNQSFSMSQIAANYRAMAKGLRQRGEGGLGVVAGTRVDGYSDDIDNSETDYASSGGRQRYGVYGHRDALP